VDGKGNNPPSHDEDRKLLVRRSREAEQERRKVRKRGALITSDQQPEKKKYRQTELLWGQRRETVRIATKSVQKQPRTPIKEDQDTVTENKDVRKSIQV